MGLFSRKSQSESEHEERQTVSIAQLEHGGLPLVAEQRLRDLGSRPTLFTSNLSVNEFVLAGDDGVRPLGQVMGASVFQIGRQFQPTGRSGELHTLSHAHQSARKLALNRLQREAELLGAHGVIGVRLERTSQTWGHDTIEWTALGTAVAFVTGTPPARPFICALSGQEFWTLRRGGYLPCGIAFGTCTYYQIATIRTESITRSGPFGRGYTGNVELTDYTQAIYKARKLAMERVTKEAQSVGGEGVIGVTVETEVETVEEAVENNKPRSNLIVHFTALGTAITPRRDRWPVIDYSVPLNA